MVENRMNEPNSRTWSYEMERSALTSYGRGRWFDPSIAHSEKVVLQEKLKQRLAYQTFVEPVCSNVEKAAT